MQGSELSPTCAVRLNAYCNVACPLLAKTHGALIAALSTSRISEEKVAWRCYAKSSLDSTGGYGGGADYCTRHAVLSLLHAECVEQQQQLERVETSPDGKTSSSLVHAKLTPWPAETAEEVTVSAVDAEFWVPSKALELLRVRAWRCVPSRSGPRHNARC